MNIRNLSDFTGDILKSRLQHLMWMLTTLIWAVHYFTYYLYLNLNMWNCQHDATFYVSPFTAINKREYTDTLWKNK